MVWRHDVMPQEPDPAPALLNGLPPIDWACAGITDWQKPKPVELDIPEKDWKASMPLPRADVVVITWTTAEWAALDHGFCDYDRQMSVDEVQKGAWREPWYDYSRNYYTIHQYMEDVKRSGQGGASIASVRPSNCSMASRAPFGGGLHPPRPIGQTLRVCPIDNSSG